MSSINTSRNVGIEDSPINVDLGLVLKADVDTSNQAIDLVEASGDAKAIARTKAQVAVLDSSITVGEAATLLATETGVLEAQAETTSGGAIARAVNKGPTGGFIDSRRESFGDADITIGTTGTIAATVKNDATAEAKAVGGPSEALADTGRVAGFRNLDIAAGDGSDASLLASVSGSMDALATSVGLPTQGALGVARASAGGERSSLVGIESTLGGGGNSISFGRFGDVEASAIGKLDAEAQSVTGPVWAESRADLVAGIAFAGRGRGGEESDGIDDLEDSAVMGPSPLDGESEDAAFRISIGEGGILSAIGRAAATAVSETVTGSANSLIGIDTIGGIIDRRLLADEPKQGPDGPGSSLTMGRDGSVEAIAVGASVAAATAVTAPEPGDVVARINHDKVVGIALEKLAIGQSGSLYAGAQSSQDATARVVSAGADPLASVADGDEVVGILNTAVRTGGDLLVRGGNEADVLARLSGKAAATAVSSGDAVVASAGEGSQVAGLRNGELTIGANVGNGRSSFKVAADSTLSADASATTGSVIAQAGGEDAGVFGLDSLPITIGKSGSIRTDARGVVVSDASTTTGDADALSIQNAWALNDTTLSIGQSGSVLANARLSGSATSETVSGDSSAVVELNAEGIDQLTRSISVGLVGDVVGRASADGDATATATTGAAVASSAIEARGIHLIDDASIAIGEEGSVVGSADGGLALLTADTVSGDAAAIAGFSVAGIDGALRSMIQAGPKGGDISGTAASSTDLLANSVTGDVEARTNGSLFGIRSVDLLGGQVGVNSLTASAEGEYLTTSTTVTGNANAHSHVDVGALIGDGNTASLSGDVVAIADLVNTVFASTVSGAATAHASGDVVGISGYDITILGSGSITASVSSSTSTVANSVTGTAM